jgi:2-polyprenyl-6-methoxyphenol hydroxylase-like FAD-dependent oxidoreductase
LGNVLISGASIAGPALAFWLQKAGFAVTLVERAPAPRPGGQAIDIRGPALAVIDRMGLLDRVRAMRTRLKGMSTLDIDGNEIDRTEERTMSGGRFDSGDIEILRDDLAELLLEATFPEAEYIYDDTVELLNESAGSVSVTFKRSQSRVFDFVIGADGLHSNVRQLAFGDEHNLLRPLGVGLAIYTTPNILNLRDWQLAYRDQTSGYVIYPARDNKELRVNIGFGMGLDEYPRGDIPAQKAMIAKRAGHLRGDIPRLLAAMKDGSDLYFGPLAQVRMTQWSKGRICLVGDAGYCPSPFTGQGTSLALVGAFVLGRELQQTPTKYADAFRRYEERMRPFVSANQDMVSVERRTHIPDDVFDLAKNAINLTDLLPLRGH